MGRNYDSDEEGCHNPSLGGQCSSNAGIVGCGPAERSFPLEPPGPILGGQYGYGLAMYDLQITGRIRGGGIRGWGLCDSVSSDVSFGLFSFVFYKFNSKEPGFTATSGFYVYLWISGVHIKNGFHCTVLGQVSASKC
eukprot:1156662-Pelagomonas_calceolata.AAC.6